MKNNEAAKYISRASYFFHTSDYIEFLQHKKGL